MSGFFELQPGSRMHSGEVTPWDDDRVTGPYEGEYLDPQYVGQYGLASKDNVGLREVYRSEAGESYSAELGWAINLVESISSDLASAESEEAKQAVLRRNALWLDGNKKLVEEAEAYIARKKAEQFVETLQVATTALANGDKETYQEVEAALQQTNPIDTEAIRARLAAAYDSTNDR